MIQPTAIIYSVAGIMSGITAWLFARKKWDGILQWLIVLQNMFIAIVMISRSLEVIDVLSTHDVDLVSSILFCLIQTWMCWFLYSNTILSDTTESVKETTQVVVKKKSKKK